MIERIDAEFLPGVLDACDVLAITGDHSTPVSIERHSADPVPFLLYHKDCRPDGATRFCEATARVGGLGHFDGINILPLIRDYLDKSEMFGE